VRGVAWAPDGARLASASEDKTVRVWDTASGKQLINCQGHADAVWGVAWVPDLLPLNSAGRGQAAGGGARLASASEDKTVRVWDAASGKHLLTCKGHEYAVYGVAWAPEGRRLASAGHDGTARVWDSTNGRQLLACRGHTFIVSGVAWAPDGRRLASAGHDGTVRVWWVG
jgi:WD40 repeat protein